MFTGKNIADTDGQLITDFMQNVTKGYDILRKMMNLINNSRLQGGQLSKHVGPVLDIDELLQGLGRTNGQCVELGAHETDVHAAGEEQEQQ